MCRHVFKTIKLAQSAVCEAWIVVTPSGVLTRNGHRGGSGGVGNAPTFFCFNASYMGYSIFENSSWILFSLWCE